MHDVIVIGAGAAGLMAAIRASELGRSVLLLEKNRKPGVKILMSGGTRCNITQATDVRGIVTAFGPSGKFLHSALAALGPDQVVEFFHGEGCLTKVEPTGKIFPVSDKALDVQQALLRRLARSGAELVTEAPVTRIERNADCFRVYGMDREWQGRRLILTTGGQSYPGCGTTGEGYTWASQLGHTIVPPRPALVPITTSAQWIRDLSGVTLPDVRVRVIDSNRNNKKPFADARGSMLLTHFGLSGPVILNVSRCVSSHPHPASLILECDLVPSVSESGLVSSLRDAARSGGNQLVLNQLTDLLPRRVLEALFEQVPLVKTRKLSEFSTVERTELVSLIKELPIPITGTLGFEKAEVTAGGVALNEVDSRTMESRLVPGLHLAGEILDLDGPIGGYNFQAAFSTGWLAGSAAGE